MPRPRLHLLTAHFAIVFANAFADCTSVTGCGILVLTALRTDKHAAMTVDKIIAGVLDGDCGLMISLISSSASINIHVSTVSPLGKGGERLVSMYTSIDP